MCTEASVDSILDEDAKQEQEGLLSINDLEPGDLVTLDEEGHPCHGDVYLKTTISDGLLVNLDTGGTTHIGAVVPAHVKRFRRLPSGDGVTLTQD